MTNLLLQVIKEELWRQIENYIRADEHVLYIYAIAESSHIGGDLIITAQPIGTTLMTTYFTESAIVKKNYDITETNSIENLIDDIKKHANHKGGLGELAQKSLELARDSYNEQILI